MGVEDFSVRGPIETRVKFPEPLGYAWSAGGMLLEQVLRLILEMIEARIRWEASYWHDELPFVCPGSAFMGRKLVREDELLRSGGLLSFPRTGCALCAAVMLSRALKSQHHRHTSPHQPTRPTSSTE